jgi:hypothetical protein
MKRLFKIIVVLLPLLCERAFAQDSSPFLKSLSSLPLKETQNKSSALRLTAVSLQKINTLPQNYYVNGLGYFCKKELAVQKATGIPLRFRLGSLEYCNRLEGK